MLSNRIRRLAPPPRPVPLTVICSAMFGATGLFGAMFLVVGLLFSLVFTYGFRPLDDIRLALSRTTARGMITAVHDTNATENDVDVYEYEFVFTTRREEQVTGRSYTTGRRWSVEAAVTIEYVAGDPAIARIQGARSSTFAPWVLFVLVFPAVGAGFFGWSAVSGLRQAALLRHGEIADARIVSTRSTGVTVNDTPMLEYSYEIRTARGEVFDGSAKALAGDQITDEESEPVLFLPSNPDRSILVDAISLRHPLDVDESTGQWISREGPLKSVLYILIWVAVILLGGYAILSWIGILR